MSSPRFLPRGAMSAVDGAALVAAAVKAAIQARAPRRTVAATAAAIARVFATRATSAAGATRSAAAPAGTQRARDDAEEGASAEELLAALRARRSAHRRRKTARRKARRAAARQASGQHDDPMDGLPTTAAAPAGEEQGGVPPTPALPQHSEGSAAMPPLRELSSPTVSLRSLSTGRTFTQGSRHSGRAAPSIPDASSRAQLAPSQRGQTMAAPSSGPAAPRQRERSGRRASRSRR